MGYTSEIKFKVNMILMLKISKKEIKNDNKRPPHPFGINSKMFVGLQACKWSIILQESELSSNYMTFNRCFEA